MSSRFRREVELLDWPEVIGVEDDPRDTLLVRAGEVCVERDELRAKCERLAGGVMFWKRQADAWRRLALFLAVVMMAVGVLKLFG